MTKAMTTSRYPRRPRRLSTPRHCARFPHTRYLTVGALWCRGVATPWIRIKGQWLKHAGFHPQSVVRLVVTEGRLVIEPAKLG